MTNARIEVNDTPLNQADVARTLALAIVANVSVFPPSTVMTAAVTAAAMIALGRPVKADDHEVREASEEFADRLLSLKTDILREDATNQQKMPKEIM